LSDCLTDRLSALLSLGRPTVRQRRQREAMVVFSGHREVRWASAVFRWPVQQLHSPWSQHERQRTLWRILLKKFCYYYGQQNLPRNPNFQKSVIAYNSQVSMAL